MGSAYQLVPALQQRSNEIPELDIEEYPAKIFILEALLDVFGKNFLNVQKTKQV